MNLDVLNISASSRRNDNVAEYFTIIIEIVYN